MESLNFESKRLMTAMAALGEIAMYAPNTFEIKHKTVIREFIVKDLIIVDRVYTFLSFLKKIITVPI